MPSNAITDAAGYVVLNFLGNWPPPGWGASTGED